MHRRHHASAIDVQVRDIQFLLTLFESRAMTVDHAAILHFDGKREAAKKRLGKLKAAGLIRERPRRPYEPSVLHLTREGHAILAEGGHLAEYPQPKWTEQQKRTSVSDLTLRHELDVMDVKAAFVRAARGMSATTVAEFRTWPLLYQFKACPDAGAPERVVKPDGFIRIHQAEDHGTWEQVFFLEVDRSTETQDKLVEKVACYHDFYRSGGMAARNGRPRSEYRQHPFRVLMVFRTSERRDNLVMRLAAELAPPHRHLWLTTADEVLQDPFGAIWVRPTGRRHPTEDARSGVRSASSRPGGDAIHVEKQSLLGD